MTIVTGAAGFIGSVLINYLNQSGVKDIIAVDRLKKNEKWRNLNGLQFDDFIDADDFLEKAKNGFDFDAQIIYHLGACSSTTEKDAGYLFKNNYEYTKELCLYALKKNLRFVYASSAATYGSGSNGLSDDADLKTLRPLNMYGYSKHMFDLWAEKQGVLNKITGLKYFNVFGPNEYHKEDMRSLVCKAYYQIRETGKINLFRSYKKEYVDGGQKRDFLYVKDAVRMTVFLAETGAAGIFNIGSGEANTWNYLAECVFEAMSIPVKINYIDMPEDIKNNYQYFTQADITKLKKAGYKEKVTSLKEAVADYIKNYLEQNSYVSK